MSRALVFAIAASLTMAWPPADASAQARGAGAGTGRGTRPAAPAKTVSVRVTVKDQNGTSIDDAHVALIGPDAQEFTTGAAGTAVIPDLKPGTVYRLRCTHDGFIT